MTDNKLDLEKEIFEKELDKLIDDFSNKAVSIERIQIRPENE